MNRGVGSGMFSDDLTIGSWFRISDNCRNICDNKEIFVDRQATHMSPKLYSSASLLEGRANSAKTTAWK